MNEQTTLNSAQLSQIEKKIRDHVATIVKDVGLRQWAVEQTLNHCSHNNIKEMSEVFETIYSFVSGPVAGEIKLNLG